MPRTLKKGNVVSILLDRVVACRGGRLPAMVTVIGDEEVDDGMFEAVYDHIAQSPPSAQLRRMKTFAITVGKRYSPANYYVNDVAVSQISPVFLIALMSSIYLIIGRRDDLTTPHPFELDDDDVTVAVSPYHYLNSLLLS